MSRKFCLALVFCTAMALDVPSMESIDGAMVVRIAQGQKFKVDRISSLTLLIMV